MKSAAAIGFDYRPSPGFAACGVAVWLLALLAIAVCGLPAWSKVAVAIVASVYAVWALRDFLRPPCRHLLWHAAGHWRANDAGGEEHIAELRHASVVGGLIVLSFRASPFGKISIVLLPDNCDSETRRRLRVRLARAREDAHAQA
jgi:toxin CptA